MNEVESTENSVRGERDATAVQSRVIGAVAHQQRIGDRSHERSRAGDARMVLRQCHDPSEPGATERADRGDESRPRGMRPAELGPDRSARALGDRYRSSRRRRSGLIAGFQSPEILAEIPLEAQSARRESRGRAAAQDRRAVGVGTSTVGRRVFGAERAPGSPRRDRARPRAVVGRHRRKPANWAPCCGPASARRSARKCCRRSACCCPRVHSSTARWKRPSIRRCRA